MADFKMDDLEDTNSYEMIEKRRKRGKIVSLIISIIIAFIVGITVFTVLNKLLTPKEVVPKDEVMSFEDENVSVLQKYVTFGSLGERNDKFINNKSVELDDFTNEEKFYYAFQFVQVEDFTFTGERDQDKNKIYLIKDSQINKYMKLFFGPDIKYSNEIELEYPFTFRINGMNVGKMVYDAEAKGFKTTFSELKEPIKSVQPLDNYYYAKWKSAIRKVDGKIVLTEKIVYTTTEENDDHSYTIKIYADYDKENLLDTIENISKEEIENVEINIDKYNTSVVSYTFGYDDKNICFFESSKITLE